MDPRYADMMGYTEEELKLYFLQHIQSITKARNLLNKKTSDAEILEEIRQWYNGYRFSERDISVYNPYSTLLFLRAKKAESYWYSTGTPSLLIDQVKKHPQAVIPLSGTTALKSTLLDISKLDRINLPALMFQTGYLTIKNYDPDEDSYRLDFPNQEV